MDKNEVKCLIRSLLSSSKTDYNLPKLLNDFRNETGCKMPCFGYKTELDFLRSIPDTVQLSGCFPNIVLKNVPSAKSAHVVSLVQNQKSYKEKHQMSRGNKHNKEMNSNFYHATDFRSDSSINKDEVLRKKKCITLKPLILQNNNKSVPSTRHRDISKLNSRNQSPEMVNKMSANHYITDYTQVPRLDLETHAKVGEYIEVTVSEVISPDNLFIQFRKYKVELIQLMKNLQSRYDKYSENYLVNLGSVKSNMLCAVEYGTKGFGRKWYRAIIEEVLNEFNVMVGLIDFGKTAKINGKSIRYLDTDFVRLPAQAVLTELAHVRPVTGTEWPDITKKRLFELTYNKDLLAGIVQIDSEVSKLSVALTDTNMGVDVHINDKLVDENLAKFNFCEETKSDFYASSESSPQFQEDEEQSLNYNISSETDERIRLSKEKEEDIRSTPKISYTTRNDSLLQMFM